MPTELKPCPFCGGEAELTKQYRLDGQTHYEVAVVRCRECECRTDDYILNGYYGSEDTTYDAINAWNRRYNESDDTDQIIRIEDADWDTIQAMARLIEDRVAKLGISPEKLIKENKNDSCT